MSPKIDVTVAAIIERDGRFLMVEELVGGQHVFNQPAGHLENGESLEAAAVREVLEETGYAFRPHALLGLFLWQGESRSFLRVAFIGAAQAPQGECRLDDGIIAAHWLSRDELARQSARLRSPMVLSCIDRYLAGSRYPLEAINDLLPPALHSIANTA
ncbi:MAG TPA: NUDIX hydrolase [Gammaproteobacteria bacterium]|nr:NUDIX hydrolase [Gammaproteobacteria bacterium]